MARSAGTRDWNRSSNVERRPLLPQLLCTVAAALLCLHPVAGQEQLNEPRNVRVHAVNTNFTLMWDNPNSCNANFTVQYQGEMKENEMWQTLPECKQIGVTECSIPSMMLDYFTKYKLRVRAESERGNSSWSSEVSFVPYNDAKIGPPSLLLKSGSCRIEMFISDPEEGAAKRIWDPRDFVYKVKYWKKNCDEKQESVTSKEPNLTLYDLQPGTVYCLKAQVCNYNQKHGYFSPVYCQWTTDAEAMPRPKNLQIHGINTHFTLVWDFDGGSSANVTFTVEMISRADRYTSNSEIDGLKKWKALESCTHISETECKFYWLDSIFAGIYYVRVEAVKEGTEPSHSKELEFIPDKDTTLGAPLKVLVQSRDGLLEIQIDAPKNHQNKSMVNFYLSQLKYKIVFWKKGSDVNKSEITEQSMWTPPDLEPWTSYCLTVQVINPYNKGGLFSPVQCMETTHDGRASVLMILMALGISAAVSFVLVMLCVIGCYSLYKIIKYTFFPSSKLPSHIQECFLDHSQKKQFLVLQSEEESGECCERVNVILTNSEEIPNKNTGTTQLKHNTQTNRDSGNYSNEGETSGSDTSEDSV